ncbi:hypothetical protein ScPMuIL_014639 [Solemya velum]
MAFGLCNSPATYARAINLVLMGLTWEIVLAFLDDILVLGDSWNQHVTNLRRVLQRFREFGLKLKPKKCELFKKEVEFLGRTVGPGGIALGPTYQQEMEVWTPPRNSKDVERFLGFVNYHRNYVKDFSKLAIPLQRLTGKQQFKWGEEEQISFNKLKVAITTAPVLTLPTSTDMFILDTDASDFAIGAELSQLQVGNERVIAYGSFTLTPEQRRYCTTRKELLAVIRFTRQFRHYLLGRPFILRTDHSSLTWLLGFKNPQGQLARWMEELSQFDMQVQHRPGAKHFPKSAVLRTSYEVDKEICKVQVDCILYKKI